MKERGIIFSAPMVRALLAGRKTMTRRIVKPQPASGVRASPFVRGGIEDGHGREIRCPYGTVGDRLWVRETWHSDEPVLDSARAQHEDAMSPSPIFYRADGVHENAGCIWRPSIFIPRWASRITLEITGIRVERLQEISAEDALAEGCPCYVCGRVMDGLAEDDCHCFHRKADATDFRDLWESINGPGSWNVNPWVWAISFRRVKHDQ